MDLRRPCLERHATIRRATASRPLKGSGPDGGGSAGRRPPCGACGATPIGLSKACGTAFDDGITSG